MRYEYALLFATLLLPRLCLAQSCAELRAVAESHEIVSKWKQLRGDAHRAEQVIARLESGRKDVNLDLGPLLTAHDTASSTASFLAAKGTLLTKVAAAAGLTVSGLLVSGGLLALRELIGKRGGLTQIQSETWALRTQTARSRQDVEAMRRTADELMRIQMAAKRQLQTKGCR